MITIYAVADGRARLEIDIVEGGFRIGWKEIMAFEAILSADEYKAVLKKIDGLYKEPEDGDHKPVDTDEGIIVCTDGPGLLSERMRGDSFSYIDGSCGEDHPNRLIAQYLQEFTQGLANNLWVRRWN